MTLKRLSLVEHLDELRKRIIICLCVLTVAAGCAFIFADSMLKFLKRPLDQTVEKFAFFSPQEALLVYIHIALATAFLIAMPVILYQVWLFVSPAMRKNFKKYVVGFVTLSFIAFLAGCVFSFFILVPAALKFLLSFAKENLVPIISVSRYISFVITLLIGCGIVFEMPVLSFILTKAGTITPKFLKHRFKYAIVAIFIIAAIITPTPDVFNMMMLAIPMLFLYQVSIWVSALTLQRKKGVLKWR